MTSVQDKNYQSLLLLKVFGIVQKVPVFLQTSNRIQDIYQCDGIFIFDTDYILVCDHANITIVIFFNLILGICE